VKETLAVQVIKRHSTYADSYYLTPTATLIIGFSAAPLHLERGGSYSDCRSNCWGEVENSSVSTINDSPEDTNNQALPPRCINLREHRMNRFCLYKLFPLCLMLANANLHAQLPNYQLHRLQEEGGLKTGDVVSMAKDAKGFLWVATQSEVQQFDGRHAVRYPFTETITKVVVDRNNGKWLITRGGVYCFQETTKIFNRVPFEQNKTATAADLLEWADGSLLSFAGGKLFRYEAAKNVFAEQHLLPVPLQPTGYYGTKEGSYFFAKKDSLCNYTIAAKSYAAIPITNVVTVVPLNAEQALVSTYQFQTFWVDFRSGKKELLMDGTNTVGKNYVLYAGVQQGAGVLLLATNRGFFHYHAAQKKLAPVVLYHNGAPITNAESTTLLHQDAKGNILLNHADGIYLLNTTSNFIQYLRNYRYGTAQLPSNNVRHFSEDPQGNIWMATTNGIARLNPQNGALQILNPSIQHDGLDYPSYRQVLDAGKRLWIGTSGNGVWVYDKRSGKTLRPSFSSNEAGRKSEAIFAKAYIWKLVPLRNGNIWVVAGSSMFLIDTASLQARQLHIQFSPAISRSAVQDASGRLWHGTHQGLVCYDTLFQPLFSLRDSLPDKRVASFCEWQPGKMLIGSKGLFEVTVSARGIQSFRNIAALPKDRLIYCMVQDKQGLVWMGTDDGIYRYDPAKETALYFDGAEHVQSQAFNSDGAFISKAGWVYLGGKNGVNYFNPAHYQPATENLQPLLLSFTAHQGDSLLQFPQQLPYDSRDIELLMSALEFKKPFRIQYRYRLQQDSASWSYAGFNNRVRINGLSPGDYRLQVSASFDGLRWFDGKDVVTFTILKPWWQMGWFRLLCLLALAFAWWQWKQYQRRRREAAQIKQMVHYLRHSTSPQASVELILWDIAGNCISRLGFEDCVIYLLDAGRQVLVQKAAYGAKNPDAFKIANPIEIPVGQGITGTAALTKQTVLVGNTANDVRYIVDDARRLSELAVPIVHEGRLLGVIDSEHPRKNFFTPHHVKTLETIASLCASRIAAALAQEASQKAAAQLQLLNGKMMESKFTNLRLQMNPHFLFNILTTIQYLIVSNQVEKATHYVDVFSGFLRSLLNHAEDSVVTLQEELRILGLYVELESLILDETFVWSVEVDEEIDKEEVLVPFMLLQPFVENAIHHGLMQKVGEKRFTIRIEETDEETLNCTVEDNGIGRAASAHTNAQNLKRVAHQSRGLGIVTERLQLLQEKTGKNAFFKIIDLHENGTAKGTAVYLHIPYYITEEV
jgi:ligand-binding sensor domain-containing protein/putative methionine-R-sulfoxide reductase with GAF domain